MRLQGMPAFWLLTHCSTSCASTNCFAGCSSSNCPNKFLECPRPHLVSAIVCYKRKHWVHARQSH
jgi:hypothetical protein